MLFCTVSGIYSTAPVIFSPFSITTVSFPFALTSATAWNLCGSTPLNYEICFTWLIRQWVIFCLSEDLKFWTFQVITSSSLYGAWICVLYGMDMLIAFFNPLSHPAETCLPAQVNIEIKRERRFGKASSSVPGQIFLCKNFIAV